LRSQRQESCILRLSTTATGNWNFRLHSESIDSEDRQMLGQRDLSEVADFVLPP
jgi:hypothetical protein